jgi:hypothetical protein
LSEAGGWRLADGDGRLAAGGRRLASDGGERAAEGGARGVGHLQETSVKVEGRTADPSDAGAVLRGLPERDIETRRCEHLRILSRTIKSKPSTA